MNSMNRSPGQPQPDSRMSALAGSFPCLRGAPGTVPWDPLALDGWAAAEASEGERLAAAFLLWAVWDPAGPWDTAKFDLGAAWRRLDDANKAAVLSWLREPFIP